MSSLHKVSLAGLDMSSVLTAPLHFEYGTGEKSTKAVILADICKVSKVCRKDLQQSKLP